MKADVVTLCHSALADGQNLSILGAVNFAYVPRVPYKLDSLALAVRLLLEESDSGKRVIVVRIVGTDGDCLFKSTQGIELPSETIEIPTLGTSHRAASLCLIFQIPCLEMKSFGEQAIEWGFEGQSLESTPFYVYPLTARPSV